MADRSMLDSDAAAAAKLELSRDGTPSSIESSPEREGEPEALQEPAQPLKRKGGRKPIYATSEERKQRNRQAQAAFRERRTEYIKQLEANIKQNEELLSSLQENHRRINNDCLMLRYKNSLLERILLEKGINVQAELDVKQGSPSLSTSFVNANPGSGQPPQPQLQRTALQRHQARMSGSRSFLPKLAAGQGAADMNYATPPHAHPTPSSHASSLSQLSTQSPVATHPGGAGSPASYMPVQAQGQQYQAFARPTPQSNASFGNMHGHLPSAQAVHQPASRPSPQSYQSNGLQPFSQAPHMSASNTSASGGAGQTVTSFYPSPLQKHYAQLDQEYDAQTARAMLDDADDDENQQMSHGAASHHLNNAAFPPQFDGMQTEYYQPAQPSAQQMATQPQFDQQHSLPPTSHPAMAAGMPDGNFNIDPNDPLLDQDPFGLSASMHYPTSYSFDQQPQPPQHGRR